MSLICKDCGCDDVRHYPDIGTRCNNCGSKNIRSFCRLCIDEDTKILMNKFKKEFSKN